MFIVQGIIRVLRDPAEAQKADEAYDALFQVTEGMYWNMYMERLNDPTVTVHSHLWREQATSEEFGVSPAFQAFRKANASTGGPTSRPEGQLSPGYWRPERDFEYSDPPTGYDRTKLGAATQSIVYVTPGKETAYVAAENAIGERLASIDGVYWFRFFHSLGFPNAYSRIIHWRDLAAVEAGTAALGELEEARKALIQEEQGDLCYVRIYSHWPERRAKDGL